MGWISSLVLIKLVFYARGQDPEFGKHTEGWMPSCETLWDKPEGLPLGQIKYRLRVNMPGIALSFVSSFTTVRRGNETNFHWGIKMPY